MHIYFSGIGGVGIGPLAEMAVDASYQVSGSDASDSPMLKQLASRGIAALVGQDGSQIEKIHAHSPIDWVVYTAALDEDNPELQFAKTHNIRASKRDELLALIIREKNLKLIAVAGTHGKTTTTGMLVWLFKQLNIPISYSVGATLSFGPSGKYDPESKYFIYECDEYDRNFLHFEPDFSLIPSIDYDHHNTYPTIADYRQAFGQFLGQSHQTYIWNEDAEKVPNAITDSTTVLNKQDLSGKIKSIGLAGDHTRANAYLATQAVHHILNVDEDDLITHIATFPGTDRRFEKLANNLYTDYGHHPTEIAATLQMARELNDDVVLVYEPHQNSRQHEIKETYADCMALASKVYWLPTYLSREIASQAVLTPAELITYVKQPPDNVVAAEMNEQLWANIQTELQNGRLVVLMGAGTIDAWARQQLLY